MPKRKRKKYEIAVKQFSGASKKVQITAFTMEEATYTAALSQQKVIAYPWQGKNLNQSKVQLNVTVECLGVVPRNPARDKAIIDAERKRKALARQAKLAERKKWMDERKRQEEELAANLRKRVHGQFAFALAQVKANGASAASAASPVTATQHVTCSNCEKPAVFLILKRLLDRNATKLDIENVQDALCGEPSCIHHAINYRRLPHIRCDELEFFFPDVLQTPVICVKRLKAAPVVAPATPAALSA